MTGFLCCVSSSFTSRFIFISPVRGDPEVNENFIREEVFTINEKPGERSPAWTGFSFFTLRQYFLCFSVSLFMFCEFLCI
jgi:hypothetical protein